MKKTLVMVLLAALTLAAVPATAESGEYSCTADVGLGNPVVGVSISSSTANLGGCSLVTLEADSTVTAFSAAEGCALSYDADGNSVGDGTPEVGQLLTAGTNVFATCQVGAVAAENSITFA